MENEKNMKNVIIILSVITVVVLIILISCVSITRNRKNTNETPNEVEETEIPYKTIITNMKDKDEYYEIKECVDKYFLYYENIANNSNNLYGILDKEYVSQYRVTEGNIPENFKLHKTNDVIIINTVYSAKCNSNINAYIVSGKNINIKSLKMTKFTIIIKADSKNQTFEVLPEDYCEDKKYNEKTVGDTLDIITENTIEKNEYNSYVHRFIDTSTYVNDMWNQYKTRLRYDVASAYDVLDKTYRETKFGNFINFREYVEKNIQELEKISIASFEIISGDEYDEYVITDKNNNYYIMKSTSVMDYTVFLDAYTTDLPEFIAKYKESTDEGKVALNLQKIIQALNNEDYSYIYSKLDDTFKKNNFAMLDIFEEYMQENFFNKNKIEFLEFKNVNRNICIYSKNN